MLFGLSKIIWLSKMICINLINNPEAFRIKHFIIWIIFCCTNLLDYFCTTFRLSCCHHSIFFLIFRKGVICQFLILLVSLFLVNVINADECHLTPVFHVLKYPGCIPKPIPSFACTGKCTSYVQVRFKVLKTF